MLPRGAKVEHFSYFHSSCQLGLSKLQSLDPTDNGFQIFVLRHSQKYVIKLIIFHAGPTSNLKIMIKINYDSRRLYEF